ncbi:hypothetical protein A3D00_02305 [Candidatus Woesebacteria bacterium RIFCSPHIGHO2_02_FULL_38_9]|nr:MAG: hypothetical protein A3D00_02305 [Candidatus Woesebacteria bacterium RIFCSPHIGHO2_02_FULL_38_9]
MTTEALSSLIETLQFSNSQASVILLRHSEHDGGVITERGKILISEAVNKINNYFLGDGPIHFQTSYSSTVSKSGQRRTENTGLLLKAGLIGLPNSRFIPEGMVKRESFKGVPFGPNIPKTEPGASVKIAKNIDGLTTSLLLLEAKRPDLFKRGDQYTFICITHSEALIPWLRSHGAYFAQLEEMPRADPIFVKLNSGSLKIDYPRKIQ